MSKQREYNIGDKVIDIKTDRIAYIAQKYQSKVDSKYYYFIVFENNTGCYRNQVFLKPFLIMTQNSTIHWQTGTPKQPGRYLVTTKYHNVVMDIWRNYADRYNNHWYEHNDEDVIAWCFLEDIEPFKF